MTEQYHLPVKFTEEERERYAAWGIKKEKVSAPLFVLFLLIAAAACIITFLILACLFGDVRSANLFADGALASLIYDLIFCLLAMLVYRPLDWLCDRIMHRPEDPRTLCLEPMPVGVRYTLTRGKKELCTGLLPWDVWESAVVGETNQIWIQGECLTIGSNTLASIYPKGKQHIWMDHPREKPVGTLRLSKIQMLMKGYLASLEEERREAEWLRQHSDVPHC